MKIQSILPIIKNNKLLVVPLAATALALSPLNSVKAQEKTTLQMNTDTVRSVAKFKSDEFAYSGLVSQKTNTERNSDSINAEMAEIREKEEAMPFYRAFIIELIAALGMVGAALFSAWDPNSKNNLNHWG